LPIRCVNTMISVLYVDDEADLLEIAKLFLEQAPDFLVDTALSAAEALQVLEKKEYDAIISDYQMPEMDGIGFLQTLRGRGETIPFIIFTGRGREEVIIEALNSGVDFYLQKGGDPTSQFAELKNIIIKSVRQKRAEDFQRQSEKRMAEILNHLPEATFAINHESRVIAWNMAIEEMTGVRAADILDKGDSLYAVPFYGTKRPMLIDLIDADDTRLAELGYEDIRREGSALIAQTTRARPQEKEMVLWIKATPFYDENGRRAGAIETMRDTTAERAAIRALRESETKYRSILENIQDVYYRSDTDGNLILASPSIAPLLGYDSVSDLIGKNIALTTYFNPEQRSGFLAEINRTGSVTNFEVTLKRKDGKAVPVITSSHKYFDADGNFQGIEGIFKDVTVQTKTLHELRAAYEQITAAEEEMRAQYEELRFGQDALRESEQKLQGIVNGSPIPQFVIDRNHKVISWNRALEVYSGVRAEEVVGTSQQWRAFYQGERPCMADLLLDDAVEEIPQWYEGKYNKSRYIEGAYEATDFFPHMGPKGTWLYFTAAPIHDEQGQVIGAVETLEDVSEVKANETAIREREQQYRSLFYENYSVSLLIDPESGLIVDANTAACEYYGYPLEKLTSMGIYDINRLARAKVLQDLQVAKSKKEKHFFTTHYLAGGEDRNVEIYSGPITVGGRQLFYSVIHDITDRRRAEVALHESESRLSAIIQGSPIPQFVIDKDHRIIQWNRALEKYSGIPAGEVTGTTLQWKAFYEEERPCMADLLIDGRIEEIPVWYSDKYTRSALIDDGYEATDFFPHMGPEGTWLHFTAALIRDAGGAVIGAVETLNDITELKNTEKNLRGSEEKYRTILDNIQDAYYRSDRDGNLVMISPSGVRLLGYDSADEILGWNIAEKIYADPSDRTRLLKTIKETGSVKDYIANLRRKDGSVVTVSTNSQVYSDAEGTVQGIEGIIRDITERRRQEESLKASENLYRSIFENTGAATIIIAPDTKILLANSTWENLTGVKKEEQENLKSWTDFIYPEDVERMKQYHYARRKDPSLAPRRYEARLVDASAAVHECIVYVDVIAGSSNSVASLVDISDLKHAEEALQQINKKLNLMSSITRHDIINQVTAVSGYLELLKQRIPGEKEQEFIQQAETAARNIEHQITFTGMYQDIGVNSPRWQQVADTVREAAGQLPLGSVRFEADLDAIEIYADPLLVKVFYNLIENALRYGEKITRIRFSYRETGEDLVIVCEDDGIGVPASDKERIFDRGFGRHTGFGLFLAREILSITGLSIRETGEPQQGARFEIHVQKSGYRMVSRA